MNALEKSTKLQQLLKHIMDNSCKLYNVRDKDYDRVYHQLKQTLQDLKDLNQELKG